MYTHSSYSLRIVLLWITVSGAVFAADADLVGPPKPSVCNCNATMGITVTPRDSGVPISGFSFGSPININVGDTVTWTNQEGTAHTSTSDTGVWDSGNLNQGQSFSFTFMNAGSFDYHCAYHAWMTSTVNVGSSNTAPSITSSLNVNATVGMPFSYTIVASGSPAPTLTYTPADVPNGFQVNGATLSGTFTATGTVTIGIHASNTAGTDDKILVVNVGSIPQITSALTDTAVAGTPYSYTIVANGTPTPTFSFTAADIPQGFNTAGPTISGTFSGPGQFSIGIHATNSSGSDDKILVVTVNSVPVITSTLTDSALANSPYSYTLTAAGARRRTLSFTTADIPPGFNVNGATLSGTFVSTGQVTIHLHATNSAGSDDETLTITVSNTATPAAILSPLTATATVGANFNYALTATGLPAPTLSFTNVPPNLTVTGSDIERRVSSGGTGFDRVARLEFSGHRRQDSS